MERDRDKLVQSGMDELAVKVREAKNRLRKPQERQTYDNYYSAFCRGSVKSWTRGLLREYVLFDTAKRAWAQTHGRLKKPSLVIKGFF